MLGRLVLRKVGRANFENKKRANNDSSDHEAVMLTSNKEELKFDKEKLLHLDFKIERKLKVAY